MDRIIELRITIGKVDKLSLGIALIKIRILYQLIEIGYLYDLYITNNTALGARNQVRLTRVNYYKGDNKEEYSKVTIALQQVGKVRQQPIEGFIRINILNYLIGLGLNSCVQREALSLRTPRRPTLLRQLLLRIVSRIRVLARRTSIFELRKRVMFSWH